MPKTEPITAADLFPHLTGRQLDALADLLAWMHDDEANDPDNYPGPGWDRPDAWTGWTEAESWSAVEAA